MDPLCLIKALTNQSFNSVAYNTAIPSPGSTGPPMGAMVQLGWGGAVIMPGPRAPPPHRTQDIGWMSGRKACKYGT